MFSNNDYVQTSHRTPPNLLLYPLEWSWASFPSALKGPSVETSAVMIPAWSWEKPENHQLPFVADSPDQVQGSSWHWWSRSEGWKVAGRVLPWECHWTCKIQLRIRKETYITCTSNSLTLSYVYRTFCLVYTVPYHLYTYMYNCV